MKRNSLLTLLLLLCTGAFAQGEGFLQVVSKVSGDNETITLSSTGMAEDRDDVYKNAVKSAFYTLFYTGVPGVNEGKPLVECENLLYTNTFFNSQYKCQYYVSAQTEDVRPRREDGIFRATYNVTIAYSRLLTDMRQNRVYDCETAPVVLPTIMTIPYVRQGESLKNVLQNKPDLRDAVSRVQDGFRSRGVRTMDFEARLTGGQGMDEYENNAGVAESNDRQMALAEGTDVYVEVDMNKETVGAGTSVRFILKAYRTESGEVLATKSATFGPLKNYELHKCYDRLEDEVLPDFLDDICNGIVPEPGSEQPAGSVAMRFAIDGNSATTMDSRFGPNNYALRDIIRQWIRRNAHNADYSTPRIVAEEIIYDYVMMPPVDADGIRMDAAQYAFLLESYLKEDMQVECSSRVIGNRILFTIY
ncbi:MAG: hypothetical protein IKK87_09865 [Bacteroidaceae bacterium]|nr:hypothetical protein [Bacteroidaceae bacterium]